MILDGSAPIPPLPPGYDPPGPVSQFFALFIGVLLLAECAAFLLSPEPWRYSIFCVAFDVWPFSSVDRWIRSWSK